MAQQFQKNDKRINRRGRKAGSTNKTTQQLRALIQSFIEDNVQDVQTQYNKLSAKDKLAFFDKLLRFVLPAPAEELQTLSDETLDRLIYKLKNAEHERKIQ